MGGLWEPNPNHAAALEDFKKRCEMFATLGLTHIYAPTTTTAKFTLDDYKTGADNMRAVGEIAKQFHMTAMAEAVRTSTFISTLPTLLRMTRAAAHPNMAPLLDCYHFWSGLNKLEDLDLIRPGEIGHVHFQDVPDMPRELLDNTTRFIPGDGVTPLTKILRTLANKGYAGPLSVELFLPKFQQGDPFEVAREIRQKGGSGHAPGARDLTMHAQAATQLLRGLRRGDIVALTLSNMVGAGIFTLPTALAAGAGRWSLAVLFVTVVLVSLMALCTVEVASRYDVTGGPMIYAGRAFGPLAGFIVGWLMYLSRLAAFGAIAAIMLDYGAGLWPGAGRHGGSHAGHHRSSARSRPSTFAASFVERWPATS